MRETDNTKKVLEVSFALCEQRLARKFFLADQFRVKDLALLLGIKKERKITDYLESNAVTRLHYGNEFCENLIPSVEELEYVLNKSTTAGIKLSLVTPLVTDSGIKRLKKLFQQLPAGTEVVVNDLGVLGLIKNEYSGIVAVAGRQLFKMMKDPRLWSENVVRAARLKFSSGLLGILKEFDVNRIELDIPFSAKPDDFNINNGIDLSLHAPYGFVLKSRVCKMGSLHLSKDKKFILGNLCGRECLAYICKTERSPIWKGSDLKTFERGNTMFYRHSPEMTKTIINAVDHGVISQIIIAGDWNENSCPN